MTTERRYKCNLCRDELNEGGIGIKFCGTTSFVIRRKEDCENHLCGSCVNGLRKAFAEKQATAVDRPQGSG